MSRLSWKRLPNGDRQCTEYPIRLRKPPGRGQMDVGWRVRIPLERDLNFDDGWLWTDLYTDAGLMEAPTYNAARALVAEHLDAVLDSLPADYSAETGEIVRIVEAQEQARQAALERGAQRQAAERDEYGRTLAAHEQALVDGLARLTPTRRRRIIDEAARPR